MGSHVEDAVPSSLQGVLRRPSRQSPRRDRRSLRMLLALTEADKGTGGATSRHQFLYERPGCAVSRIQ